MNFDFVIPRVACTLLIVFCSGFSHTGEWVQFEGKHLCHFRYYLFFYSILSFCLFVCLFCRLSDCGQLAEDHSIFLQVNYFP